MHRNIKLGLTTGGGAITGILSGLFVSKHLESKYETNKRNFKKCSDNGINAKFLPSPYTCFAIDSPGAVLEAIRIKHALNIRERIQLFLYGRPLKSEGHIVHVRTSHPLWLKLNEIGCPSEVGVNKYIYGNFTAMYNMQMRIPEWTFEVLTLETSMRPKTSRVLKPLDPFPDPTMDPKTRVTKEDFQVKNESGRWSMGQMASRRNYIMNADHDNYEMTMVMTNMCPMYTKLKEGLWTKVEEFQQELASSYPTVLVFTGPIVKSLAAENSQWPTKDAVTVPLTSERLIEVEVIGPDRKRIVVPTSFFKVIVCEDKDGTRDFWFLEIPNIPLGRECDVKNFTTDLKTISDKTGLNFLEKLRNDKEKGTISFGSLNGKPCPADIL